MAQFSLGFLIKHNTKSYWAFKVGLDMHTHLYQSYSHANNILDNTGNYKRKIPKTFCMYIYLDGQLIHQKRMHFLWPKNNHLFYLTVIWYITTLISLPLSQNLVMVQYELNTEVNLVNCKMQNSGQTQEMRQG